jgi:hypothetical protein
LAVVLLLSGWAQAADVPPPEVLENLEFFRSMDLLEKDTSAKTKPKVKKPQRKMEVDRDKGLQTDF